MATQCFRNIHEEKCIETKINFYYILIYIIVYKVKNYFLKSLILKRDEKLKENKLLFFRRVRTLSNLPDYEKIILRKKMK